MLLAEKNFLAAPVVPEGATSPAGFVTFSYELAPLMLANDDFSLFSVVLKDPRTPGGELIANNQGVVASRPSVPDGPSGASQGPRPGRGGRIPRRRAPGRWSPGRGRGPARIWRPEAVPQGPKAIITLQDTTSGPFGTPVEGHPARRSMRIHRPGHGGRRRSHKAQKRPWRSRTPLPGLLGPRSRAIRRAARCGSTRKSGIR